MASRLSTSRPLARRRKTGPEFRLRVGARIQARRVELGLSQSQLARRLPGTVEGSQVSRWERGESFPAYTNMLELARALECSEERLLCGCDPP